MKKQQELKMSNFFIMTDKEKVKMFIINRERERFYWVALHLYSIDEIPPVIKKYVDKYIIAYEEGNFDYFDFAEYKEEKLQIQLKEIYLCNKFKGQELLFFKNELVIRHEEIVIKQLKTIDSKVFSLKQLLEIEKTLISFENEYKVYRYRNESMYYRYFFNERFLRQIIFTVRNLIKMQTENRDDLVNIIETDKKDLENLRDDISKQHYIIQDSYFYDFLENYDKKEDKIAILQKMDNNICKKENSLKEELYTIEKSTEDLLTKDTKKLYLLLELYYCHNDLDYLRYKKNELTKTFDKYGSCIINMPDTNRLKNNIYTYINEIISHKQKELDMINIKTEAIKIAIKDRIQDMELLLCKFINNTDKYKEFSAIIKILIQEKEDLLGKKEGKLTREAEAKKYKLGLHQYYQKLCKLYLEQKAIYNKGCFLSEEEIIKEEQKKSKEQDEQNQKVDL